jgi:hypothetical protein
VFQKVFVFWITQIFWVFPLATILIKNVPEDVLKELKRLKVELGCKTWADLLSELMTAKGKVCLTAKERRRMKKGVEGFLKLQDQVSEKWKGPPSVLEEIRRSRHHEAR